MKRLLFVFAILIVSSCAKEETSIKRESKEVFYKVTANGKFSTRAYYGDGVKSTSSGYVRLYKGQTLRVEMHSEDTLLYSASIHSNDMMLVRKGNSCGTDYYFIRYKY